MNEEILGHIEGLLEGWNCEWDNMSKLSANQIYRLRELFRHLHPAWLVKTMGAGKPSDIRLLTKLSEL